MSGPRYSRRPDAAELRRLYIDEGRGCPEIARSIGADPSTVRLWLVAAGIPTRSRGDNPAVHFQKGAPSAFKGHRHTPEAIAKVRASTIQRGQVPYLRDGKHWLQGEAPEMNPRYLGGATPERQTFYRSAEWKVACSAVWQRADAHCQRCGLYWNDCDRDTTPTFQVHHVWSFQIRETRANPALMVLLCRPCHLFVHSRANVMREFLPQELDGPLFPAAFELEAMAFIRAEAA